MERHVKERLIGAAVLVAAAVILIPEMLSGRGGSSGDDKLPTAVISPGDTALKTYTIDLNRSTTQSAATGPGSLTTNAPPPEAAPAPETQSQAASTTAPQAIPEPKAESAAAVRGSPTGPATSAPAAVPLAAPKPVPVDPAPARNTMPDKPANGGFAVQLGSFSSRATADSLAAKLRSEGYDAFVMPVKSGTNTLYRVRIGPMPDREAAMGVVAKVKGKIPAATVVKHP